MAPEKSKKRRKTMGEYDCCNCGETFHLHEPPFDGSEICDPCRESYKSSLAEMLDNPLETLAKLNLRGDNHVGH
jgi:hypothetical protein